MALRLSELLERIRPAGAPGAAADSEQRRDPLDRAREIAEIVAMLQAFDEEADAVISGAGAKTAEIEAETDLRIHQVRAGVSDRIAIAEAEAVVAPHEVEEHERTRTAEATRTEIGRLEARADVLIPSLVTAALEVVWALAEDEE